MDKGSKSETLSDWGENSRPGGRGRHEISSMRQVVQDYDDDNIGTRTCVYTSWNRKKASKSKRFVVVNGKMKYTMNPAESNSATIVAS